MVAWFHSGLVALVAWMDTKTKHSSQNTYSHEINFEQWINNLSLSATCSVTEYFRTSLILVGDLIVMIYDLLGTGQSKIFKFDIWWHLKEKTWHFYLCYCAYYHFRH